MNMADMLTEDQLPLIKVEDISPANTVGGVPPESEETDEENDDGYGDDVNFITGPDGQTILPDEEDHEDDDVISDDDDDDSDEDDTEDDDDDDVDFDEDDAFDEDAAFEEDEHDDGEQFL